MKVSNQGLLIVFSGPSGCGKDTVLQELLKINSNIQLSISATTRDKRPGEEHEREYYFIDKERFQAAIDDGSMIEYAIYCGNYYGTPRQPVNEWLDMGYDVVLEIEVDGASQIRAAYPESVGIFVVPPSLVELKNRLVNRGTETGANIKGRLMKAKKEICEAIHYDYVVVNHDVHQCAKDICSIIRAEKMKTTKMGDLLREVLAEIQVKDGFAMNLALDIDLSSR